MASQAQIDANRSNAQLSTGPKTPEGKAAVSRNALKHGFRSNIYQQVLESEDAEGYDQLLADLIAEHQPQTVTEESYVERMALCLDKLGLLEGLQHDLLILHAKVGPGEEKTLSIYWNQQDCLERGFDRALTMLRKLQKERRAAPAAQAASEKPVAPAAAEKATAQPAAEKPTAPAASQNEHPAPAAPPQPIKPAPEPVLVPIPGVAIHSSAEPPVPVLSQIPEEIASCFEHSLPEVA